MPIYGKNHSNGFFPRTIGPIRLIFCRKQMSHLPAYIKLLKSFRSDHKQTFSGWGKIGKNDVNFQIHEPFELEKLFS